MYNSDTPVRAELPTSKQLFRSTILAIISAFIILVAVVLPAEYGIDPTGVGRVFQLTDMGKIKQQLKAQAAADAALSPNTSDTTLAANQQQTPTVAASVSPLEVAVAADVVEEKATTDTTWRDETPFTLSPGEGLEIKLKMIKGGQAPFNWVVTGGAVNFDTHGDGLGQSISYEKGRGVDSDEGVLVAAFTGNHGWFWRNRGQSDVQVVLRTRGDYSVIKR